VRLRRPLALLTGLATAGVLAAALPAARGDLDPTFGSGGKVTTDFGGSEVGWAVVVQPDSRVVVAGGRSDSASDDFVLARYTTKGALDSSFDGDGKVATDFDDGLDLASDVEVQGDGKLVAAGRSFLGEQEADGSDFAVARYNRDGSLDPTFGEGGKVLTTFEFSGIAGASAVLIQADGKIVAGGSTGGGLESDFALVRYLANGELDPSFGDGGRVSTPISNVTDWLLALALQPDGKLVAAGYSYESLSRGRIALARYNPDGGLDPSFDGDGIVVATSLPFGMVGEQLLLGAGGRLLVAGIGGVSRFNDDGSLDRSFGDGGRASSGNVDARTAAIQPDGKILVIGTVATGTPAAGDFGVTRLTATGRLDRTYGRRGSVVTGFSSGSDDQAEDGVLLPDGKLVVSGMSNPRPQAGTWGPWNFAVARYVAIRPCIVPNVRGQTLSAARARLVRAGCRLGTVRRTHSSTVGRGRVISQRPRARTRLAELAKVSLVVSRGRRR
jgi:uncharacterized delta-60 repeat protein